MDYVLLTPEEAGSLLNVGRDEIVCLIETGELGGLKIAGGLSLIGAVVAEFTAGTAGRETGLASRILESSFRTEIPMMFAALFLVSLLGIVIFVAFSALAKLMLGHWHESEMRLER